MSFRLPTLLACFLLFIVAPVSADVYRLPDMPLWPIANIGPEIDAQTISEWRKLTYSCEGKSGSYAKFPSKRSLNSEEGTDPDRFCEDGDTNLFNGMLCAIGEQAACTAVKQSQAPDGQWFRSPRRRAYFQKLCALPSSYSGTSPDRLCLATFSPDMSLGTMLYAVKTNDRAAYKRWHNWLKNNTKETKLCTSDCTCIQLSWPRVCQHDYVANKDHPDGTCPIVGDCALRPQDAPDIRITAQHLLLAPNTGSSAFDSDLMPPHVLTVLAVVEEEGFTQHLNATRLLLRMLIVNNDLRTTVLPSMRTLSKQTPLELGEFSPALLRASALAIEQKSPWNPYFSLLAHGPTANVKAKIMESCPKPGDQTNGFSWMWEQASNGAHRAPINSSGWDCIFVATLYNRMRVSPKMGDQLLGLVKESLDPVQMTINSLNVAITAQQDAITKLQKIKDEHTKLTNFVATAMQDAESERRSLDANITNTKEEIDRATGALAGMACDAPRRVLRQCGRTCRRLAGRAFRSAQQAVQACDATSNTLSVLHGRQAEFQRNLSDVHTRLAQLPTDIEKSKTRIVEIESQRVLDKLAALIEVQARLAQQMQAARDNYAVLEGLGALWADK